MRATFTVAKLVTWALASVLFVAVAHADDAIFQSLTVERLADMQASHHGQRQVVMYWSLTCIPCRGELAELAQQENIEKLAITLVNTGEESVARAAAFIRDNGLEQLPNWRFADDIPARLRAAIDDDWFGELPFSVAIDTDGQRFTQAGKTDIDGLVSWLGH